jgi:hypothetical protein
VSTGESIAIKQDNVQQMIEQCEVLGLQSRPELNGEMGTVREFDPVKGRVMFHFSKDKNTVRD